MGGVKLFLKLMFLDLYNMKTLFLTLAVYLGLFCLTRADEDDRNKWLGIVIPEIEIKGQGFEVLDSVAKAINEMGGAAMGFSRFKYDDHVATATINAEFSQRNISIEKLLPIIADQLRAMWSHHSGLVFFERYSPDEKFHLELNKEMSNLFGIKYLEDDDEILRNFVERLENLGSLLQSSHFEKVPEFEIFKNQNLYVATASRREIEYLRSLINILERGFIIENKIKPGGSLNDLPD